MPSKTRKPKLSSADRLEARLLAKRLKAWAQDWLSTLTLQERQQPYTTWRDLGPAKLLSYLEIYPTTQLANLARNWDLWVPENINRPALLKIMASSSHAKFLPACVYQELRIRSSPSDEL